MSLEAGRRKVEGEVKGKRAHNELIRKGLLVVISGVRYSPIDKGQGIGTIANYRSTPHTTFFAWAIFAVRGHMMDEQMFNAS